MTIARYLGITTALAAVATGSNARADQLSITEKPGHVTEGVVTVDASPSQVYALVTDYRNWRSVFSDVQSVSVQSGGQRDATVRFRSHALQHEVTVRFDNVPDLLIRFKGIHGPPGGRASGSFELTPLAGGTRTLVRGRLYMDVVGLPSLFISDSRIRSMREAKLRADMTDVLRRFPPPPRVSAQAPQS
ncbi:MAG TPA: SRPBCC family protein [Kofleriaceae bacterium]|nr:SRPBCC family protein [Kofleriaceae bacterium]